MVTIRRRRAILVIMITTILEMIVNNIRTINKVMII